MKENALMENEMDCNDERGFLELSQEKRMALLNWIKQNLLMSKQMNKSCSSYGIKNIFEQSSGGFYITNGQFKGAMKEAGFRYEVGQSGVNWHFNVLQRSVRAAQHKQDK